MVAASATAILNDIDCLRFVASPQAGVMKSRANPVKRRLAHAFLTACLNEPVSTLAQGLALRGVGKKMLQTK
jgi:hypothetical protein